MTPDKVALLVGAGFLAISVLVRLMVARRDALAANLQRQADAEIRKKKKQAAAEPTRAEKRSPAARG